VDDVRAKRPDLPSQTVKELCEGRPGDSGSSKVCQRTESEPTIPESCLSTRETYHADVEAELGHGADEWSVRKSEDGDLERGLVLTE